MILASALIREARRRSGLTQAQLAARAGTTQSVISAYERRHREPSFATLQRLIEAAGMTLESTLAPLATHSALLDVQALESELKAALAPLGARNIRVFGSVARGDETPESDVDLLIDLADETGLFDLLRMQEAAEQLLGRPVDIVPSSGLKADAVERITREAVPLRVAPSKIGRVARQPFG